MDKKQVVAAWLGEKFGNDQQKLLVFLLENSVDTLLGLEECQSWLKAKRAQIEAAKTAEALEAEKLGREQALTNELEQIDKLIVGKNVHNHLL